MRHSFKCFQLAFFQAQQMPSVEETAAPQSVPRGGFRRCSSVPSLSGMATNDAMEGEGLDVYVALRPFYCKLPLVDGLKVRYRSYSRSIASPRLQIAAHFNATQAVLCSFPLISNMKV